MKLGLIGGPAIDQCSVAARLWELLAVAANVSIEYEVVPLKSPREVHAFFKRFRQDSDYKGINIGIPWKTTLLNSVDEHIGVADLPAINTIYKNHGLIVGENTDPLAAQRAIEYKHNLYQCKTALVLGKHGSGSPFAEHLRQQLHIETFLYDTARGYLKASYANILESADGVKSHRYDLIINAIPAGRHYRHYGLAQTRSPLSLKTLRQISTPRTIVMDTNYLPAHPPLLRLAAKLELPTVAGDLMLVFRGVESLKRFTGVLLNEGSLSMIVGEIGTHIAEREAALYDMEEPCMPYEA